MENMTDLKEVLTSNQCECDCHQQVDLLLQNALKDKKEIREQELKLAKLEGLVDKIKDKDQTIAAMQWSIDLFKNINEPHSSEYKAKLSQYEAIIKEKQDQLDKLQAIIKEKDNLINKEKESRQLQIDELKATITNVESRLQATEASLKEEVDQLAVRTLQISDFVPGIRGQYQSNIKMVSFPGCKAFAAQFGDMLAGPGWMVIQQRFDGSVKFENKRIEDYISGFGELNGEFWLGLEKMHLITSSGKWELNIKIRSSSGQIYFVRYDHFVIGNKSENYCLKSLGEYMGTLGDGMANHLHGKFYSDWWTTNNGPETSNLNGKMYGGIKWYPLGEKIEDVKMLIELSQY